MLRSYVFYWWRHDNYNPAMIQYTTSGEALFLCQVIGFNLLHMNKLEFMVCNLKLGTSIKAKLCISNNLQLQLNGFEG